MLNITSAGFAQNSDVQNKINYYKEKAEKYLDKQKGLEGYYSIDKSGIKVFASSKDKLSNKVEYCVSWDSIQQINNPSKPKPESIKKLTGYRIAIDA